jgi:hypothetical protein
MTTLNDNISYNLSLEENIDDLINRHSYKTSKGEVCLDFYKLDRDDQLDLCRSFIDSCEYDSLNYYYEKYDYQEAIMGCIKNHFNKEKYNITGQPDKTIKELIESIEDEFIKSNAKYIQSDIDNALEEINKEWEEARNEKAYKDMAFEMSDQVFYR